MVVHTLSMDLQGHENTKWVDVVQGDHKSRRLKVLLYSGKLPWQIPEETAVLIRYKKQNGDWGEYDALRDGTKAWEASGNALMLQLVPEILEDPGVVMLSVVILQEERILNSFPVEIRVQKNMQDSDSKKIRDTGPYFCVTGFLPAPQTGEIGQILQIADVNAQGKVTRIHAVDMPEGSNGDVDLSGYVQSVNGTGPDENGNVELVIPEGSGGSGADLLNEDGVLKQSVLPEGYPYSTVAEVLPETTPIYSDGTFIFSEGATILDGGTYIVNWNDMEYTVIASIIYENNNIPVGVLGNFSALDGAGDTGEPFVIMLVPPEYVEEAGFGGMAIDLDRSESVTVSIKGYCATAIDKSLLPEGYPHKLGNETTILPGQSVENYAQISLLGIVTGGLYRVTCNDTDYVCEAKLFESNYVYLGNGKLANSQLEDTGEPFVLACNEDTWLVILAVSPSTLKIVAEAVYVPIDERYIPSHIKGSNNYNIENGLAIGSLRAISAKKEVPEATDTTEGYLLGAYATAFGEDTKASGESSHAEGYATVASGKYSHAEGSRCEATGTRSHAEGEDTLASGSCSHAEGEYTRATGTFSHAEGEHACASGKGSHAEGQWTEAASEYQHVEGVYNAVDADNQYAHIVGNGSNTVERSNAHTLDWNGVGWFAGGLQVGGTRQDGEGAKQVLLTGDTAPNPHALTINGTIYDGSQAVSMTIQGGSGDSVPDYVRTEAEAVARIVNQHQSNHSIVFPFLTDAHCGYYTDTNNAAVSLAGQLLRLIGKRTAFDFIVHGGDMSTGAWDTTREKTLEQIEDYSELINDLSGGTPVVWTAGNHDDAPFMATADRLTQKDTFSYIGRKNRVSGAVCPDGCNYGYLDLENHRLRVIYLDTDDKREWGTVSVGSGEEGPAYLNAHNLGGAQLQWLADTALNFTDKEKPEVWGIVVVSHVALNISGTITDAVSAVTYDHSTANAAQLLHAYKKGLSGMIEHNGTTVSYDFSEVTNRAAVLCSVHGHNHSFCSETLTGNLLSIGCPNIMNGRERESDDGVTYTKTAGTAEETSFCIITIDRENSLIYADCVGVGPDREFSFTTEVAAVTNQIPISVDMDGSIYNGIGYKEGYRLGSSGTESTESGSFVTGFIPCKVGDTVYMKNVTFQYGVTEGLASSNQRLSFYDSAKTHIVQPTASSLGGVAAGVKGEDGIWTQFTVKQTMSDTDCSAVAYFRINGSYIGTDSVISINEPIV